MAQFVTGSVLTASSLNSAFNTQTIATATTSYTLGSANAGELVLLNSSSAGTVTIPLDATYNFATGTIIGLYNAGTASFTVATAGTASTVSGSSTTLTQYSAVTLLKTAASTWYLAGGTGSPKASVSSTTGSPTIDTSSRPGKTIYKFTGTGSITTTAGQLEYMVVGGGGGGGGGSPSTVGCGGNFQAGITTVLAETITVTVGSGGAAGPSDTTASAGTTSSLGTYVVSYGGYGGAGFPRSGGGSGATYSSSITGSSVTYGVAGGGATANRGGGGTAGGPGGAGGAGGTGFVVVVIG